MIFQVILTSIAMKPYIFVIFQGGMSSPTVPPLDPRMVWIDIFKKSSTKENPKMVR